MNTRTHKLNFTDNQSLQIYQQNIKEYLLQEVNKQRGQQCQYCINLLTLTLFFVIEHRKLERQIAHHIRKQEKRDLIQFWIYQ